MPLARRCTFQLRTLSLLGGARGAGGTTTARSGHPPPPDQFTLVLVSPRPTPQRYRAAARIIRVAQRRSRRVVSQPPCQRLAVAPPSGRAACRRRFGAARCRSELVLAPAPSAAPLVALSCPALRCVRSLAPASRRRAAFRPRRVRRRCGAARRRSEPVLARRHQLRP